MRRIFLCSLLCIVITTSQAQKFSIVYFAGAANYKGDLQLKSYTFDQAHPVGGIGLAYEITDHFIASANLSIARVSATDSRSDNAINRARNLSFTSNIEEFNINMEYDLLSLQNYKATPYLFAGLGIYHFKPYTSDSLGDKIYLQPLGTEGEGYNGSSKYSLTQINIPYGFGLKFAITKDINLGFEIGYRKLFTDYLDDVSGNYADPAILPLATVPYAYRGQGAYPAPGTRRGGPAENDSYYFSVIKLSFKLRGDQEKDFNKMQLMQVQCPKNLILY